VAEVIEVGETVQALRVGDLVSVPFQISCGSCARCRRGHTGLCSAVPAYSAYGLAPFSGRDWGGALADAMLVPFADAMLVRLPAGLPLWLLAGACDNISDGYRCVAEPLEQEPGARVLVIGGRAASVGLYAVCAARALGASEVVYVDDSRERNTIAEGLGARVIECEPREDSELGRFPITVDACSTPAGLRLALASTDSEGTCTSAGMYAADVPFTLLPLYMRGIRFLTGRTHSRAVLPHVLAHMASGALQAASIVPRRVAWQDAAEAWLEPATKLVVERATPEQQR
jgi:alcohol dehydrogenase